MTRRIRTLTFITCAAALGALTACASEEGIGEAEAPLEGTEVADGADMQAEDGAQADGHEGRRHRKGRHHMGHRQRGGPHMLMRAVENLDLTEEQRDQVDALKEKARGEMRASRDSGPPDARMEMRKALSEAVLTGTVNVADFDDELDAAEARALEHTKKMLNGLSELRAVLTPEQRIALVADMKAKHEKHAEKRAKMKEKWAGEKGKRAKRHRRGGHMAKRLGLSEAQRAKLDEARTDAGLDQRPPRPDEGRMTAVLEAFASDSFDVDALAASSPMPKMARTMAERKIEELSVLVPILDDAQRTSLSGKIAEGRKRHGPAKGRRGGRRGARGR